MQAYFLAVRVLLTPPAEAAASQKWKIIYLQVLSTYDKMVKIYFNLILVRITEAFPYDIVPKYLIRVQSLSIIGIQPFL